MARWRSSLPLWLLAAALPTPGAGQEQALSWRARADWEAAWVYPAGTLELGADGSVRPRYMRKGINASVDAAEFVAETDNQRRVVRRGGILAAGSNQSTAGRILDGDPDTYWSPQATSTLKERWVEVDLGRLVTATAVVLRMRPGRPLEQFAVYVADGQEAFYPGSGVKDYQLVGNTTQPNRQERLEYALAKERVDGEDVPRQHVRYVYLELTSAPPDPGGLAELEVHSLGDNAMLGVLERFGSLVMGRDGAEEAAVKVADGSLPTREDLHAVIFNWRQRGWLRVDLGSVFWLDAIRTIGFNGPLTRAVVGYKLFVSDGRTQPGSATDPILKDLVWQEVASLERNPPPGETTARFLFEDHFAPRPVRYILWSNRNNEEDRGPAVREEISEIQAFGEGYVPGAALTTKLIDLGGSRNLTAVEWEADTPSGTAVEVRTRTGDEIDEIDHYFCRNGLECTKRDWDKEASLFGSTGPLVVEQRPDTTWSPWSPPYAFSGESFLSPSPRRFLLVEAKLVSQGPAVAPTLRAVRLSHARPLAQSLHGALSPRRVPAATPTVFTYAIQADFRPGQSGFDEVLVRTPTQAELLAVHLGSRTLRPDELDSVFTAPETLFVRLPERVRTQQPPAVVQVDLRTTVLDDNTAFDVFVSDSRVSGRQRVDPNPADGAVVRLEAVRHLLSAVRLAPRVVTPNGDGVNDELTVEFVVARLLEPRPVEVAVHGLDGRRLARLAATEIHGRTGLGGRYRARWDGRGDDGQPVAPGVYAVRLRVQAEAETDEEVRLAAVAY